MPRSRNIKPGFFSSEELGLCDHGARLLFAALWTLADREGRIEDRPMRIRAYAFPYDAVTAEDVEKWLAQLESHGLIARYENGAKVICVEKFKKHQNPHVKELPSTLPDKPGASPVLEPDFQNTTCEKVPDKNQTFPHSSCEETGLIPDSLILNPESLLPAPKARPTPLPATPTPSTPIGLWVEKLRDRHPTPCEPRFVHQFCFDNWHRLGEDGEKYEFFMDMVLEGLESHCRYWAEDGNRFAMALDKWLNAGGWKKAPPERKTAMTEQEARRKRQEAIDASWEMT